MNTPVFKWVNSSNCFNSRNDIVNVLQNNKKRSIANNDQSGSQDDEIIEFKPKKRVCFLMDNPTSSEESSNKDNKFTIFDLGNPTHLSQLFHKLEEI